MLSPLTDDHLTRNALAFKHAQKYFCQILLFVQIHFKLLEHMKKLDD